MRFFCRMLIPRITEWKEVEADTAEEAVQEFHFTSPHIGVRFKNEYEPGRFEHIDFAQIEVARDQTKGVIMLSRIYSRGIWRKGGIPARDRLPTIKDVATKLGYPGEPAELLAKWEGEETWEEAAKR